MEGWVCAEQCVLSRCVSCSSFTRLTKGTDASSRSNVLCDGGWEAREGGRGGERKVWVCAEQRAGTGLCDSQTCTTSASHTLHPVSHTSYLAISGDDHDLVAQVIGVAHLALSVHRGWKFLVSAAV